MKTIVDEKRKKRSLSETSVSAKSNQEQGNINELKKGSKKAKLAGIKQNGNPSEEKSISKVVDKQKKDQNKITKQQSNIVKPSETKEVTELTDKFKKETGNKLRSKSRRRYPYSERNLSPEQIKKKNSRNSRQRSIIKDSKKNIGYT